MTDGKEQLLKKGPGTGPTKDVAFAAFEKGTSGEQIVDYWISVLEKQIDAEKAARAKKDEEDETQTP
jgi:hypothetical protein